MPQKIHVIGASGRSGAALCRALIAAGDTPVPVVRSAARWAATGLPGAPRLADLADAAALRAALADARADTGAGAGAETGAIVSCAHARHAAAILAAAPATARFVFLGSTRKFTRYPDAHGNGVLAGEAAFLASRRAGVMLHPTMIYGAEGEDNVQRLAALLRRLPLVPLPGGGASLVQPIHQADVTASIRAALARPWHGPQALVIAGPAPVSYADFVRAVAHAAGLPRPRILPLPAAALIAGAWLTRLPGLPTIRPAEIRRLLEDKAFDIAPMRAALGVAPAALADGLAQTFGQTRGQTLGQTSGQASAAR
jgi:nucleoside-diphosphate-sugar epimerase